MAPSTTPAQPLTRRRIFEAAIELVDGEGGAALTMRRLGDALGVEAMSLYHHVQGREDLLDGMVGVMVEALPIAPEGDHWDVALRSFAQGIRHIATSHPEAFRLVGLRPLRGSTAHRSLTALLLCLRDGGLSPDLAVTAFRSAVAFVRGYVLAEFRGFTLATATDATSAGLPDLEDFTSALTRDPAEAFEDGLDLLVAGVRQRLEAPARDAPGVGRLA